MASINKSFNFRHGVQVDDDDFTVRGGLVGIGTTVPTESLDVRGNAVVSGLTSSISLQVTGVTTLTTVDIGITSITSGIITASSGIVTFYGDGQYLQHLPTSQWLDIDVGLGYTSIYNNGGNVGISTNDPRNSLQIGGDPNNLSTGVGINSTGNIRASGVVTATRFIGEFDAPSLDTNAAGIVVSGIVTATSLQGALTGNVTGNVSGDLTGEVNSSKFDTNPSGIVVTGVATATSFVGDITGNVTGNADTATTLATARNIGGVSFNGSADINLPGVNAAGNQNTTGTATNLSGTPNISVGAVTASSLDISGGIDVDGHTDLDNVSISGVTTFTGATTHSGGATVNTHLDVIGLTTLDDVNVSSGATFGGAVNVTGNMQSANLGLGIAPTTDLQIYNASGESAIVLGKGTAITGNNASIRSNTTNASFPYSANQESLDIINYGKGNINFYLEAGTTGLGTGGFYWHRRSNYDQLMALTYDAKLGIGITSPLNTLHVVGTSTITDNSFFGADVRIKNNLVVDSQISAGLLVIDSITSHFIGSVSDPTGVSTFRDLVTLNHCEFANGVGIGCTDSEQAFSVNNAEENRFCITPGGQVAIGGTPGSTPANIGLDASRTEGSFKGIMVGKTTGVQAPVDFGSAGITTQRFMIPPKVTTAQRNALVGAVDGAMLYNTSLKRLEVYAGTGWVGVATVA